MKDLPEPFNFYRMVLDSDHLHFGLWPEGQSELSLEQAQEEMFALLVRSFPKPPAAVLDVGCGLGKAAFDLAMLGYQVTAIAPSDALIAYAQRQYTHSNLVFYSLGYLEIPPDSGSQQYDVLFFQESLQYLRPLEEVFGKARSFLHPKGLVIIGDEILYDPGLKDFTAVHLVHDVETAMLQNGFRLKRKERLGRYVCQTCQHIIERFEENQEVLRASLAPEEGQNQDNQTSIDHYLQGWKNQKTWYGTGQFDYCLLVARKDAIFCREYEPSDEHEILQLFEQVFGQKRTLDHWLWKFRDNPFGSMKIVKAVAADGSLAAHFSGYPVPVAAHGISQDVFLTYQVGDTMTNPAFRGHGLGQTSVLARTVSFFYNRFCQNQVPFVYGFNTGNIRKFGERYLKYQYSTPIPYHVLEVKRLQARSFMSRLRQHLGGYTIEQVRSLDQEFDTFFDQVAEQYGLLIKRTSEYLNWRYFQCPDGIHHFYAVRRFGNLVGWSVFTTKETTLIWGDALFEKRHAHSVRMLLQGVIRTWYPEAQTIAGWFSPVPRWWTEILEWIGFESLEEPHNLAPAFVFFDPQWSTDVFESRWYYTMGDSDLF